LNGIVSHFRKTLKVEPIADKKYAKMTVTAPIDEELLKECPEIEIDRLKIEIEVKSYDDENLIVEFKKLSGEKYEFFEIYDGYIEGNKIESI